MFILINIVYLVTFAGALFFAYWEARFKRELTDQAFRPSEKISDFGAQNDLAERIQREKLLASLPKSALVKYKRAVVLKFVLVALLIAEVIVLHRIR